MPELPEVETTRRGIAPRLIGQRVTDVVVRERRLRWPIQAEFEATLRHQIIRGVERRAKYLLLRFDSGTLILHLGMSGSLRIVDSTVPARPHDHWDMRLESDKVLRFHDPRRFGSAHWTASDPHAHPLLAKLGPEPLGSAFDAIHLFRATRKRSVAIKQLIMDSHIVVGVGNIYASEALFRARISPRRVARRITQVQAGNLAQAIKQVLAAAIKIGGTTLRDYVNADGISGYFRQQLFVYERRGEPCRICKTPVGHFVQGQRSTFWCKTCQR